MPKVLCENYLTKIEVSCDTDFMQIPKELTTVTPLSRLLALLLFILLPILGFVFGINYQKTINSQQYNRNVIENNSSQQTQSVIHTPTNNYNYESNPLLRCTIDSDCMLVQTGWCKTIRAINKTNLTEWQNQDRIETQNAQRANQTCKVSNAELNDINNYTPACANSICEAKPNSLSKKGGNISPDYFDSRSIQAEKESVFINFSSCTPDEKQIYAGFGSTTIAIDGKSGNTCTMRYGGEIENPNWNGELSYTCNVPQTLGKMSFPLNNYGVNFQTIQQYCSK